MARRRKLDEARFLPLALERSNGRWELPWWPRYVQDYFGGTRDFNLKQKGAYDVLLDYQWEAGYLPKDIRRIAPILGVSLAEAKALWSILSAKFPPLDDQPEKLVNRRLWRERAWSIQLSETNRSNRGGDDRPAEEYDDRTDERPLERVNSGTAVSTDVPEKAANEERPYDTGSQNTESYKETDDKKQETHSRASARESPPPTENAWGRPQWMNAWDSVPDVRAVGMGTGGNWSLYSQLAADSATSAARLGVADVPAHAKRLVESFVEWAKALREAGQPAPQNLTPEAFERNFSVAEQWLRGDRSMVKRPRGPDRAMAPESRKELEKLF